MSQCNLGEPWRVEMNAQLKAAADKHPNLKLVFKDAQNDTLKQRAHVEEFVSAGVDLLIISPKEAQPLTEPVAKAMAASEHPRRRKALLAVSLTFNLALLGYFKYANFFVDNFNAISGTHLDIGRVILNLITNASDALGEQQGVDVLAHHALFDQRPEHQAANAAEPIDCNFHSHNFSFDFRLMVQ